jgi:hypothetical protein
VDEDDEVVVDNFVLEVVDVVVVKTVLEELVDDVEVDNRVVEELLDEVVVVSDTTVIVLTTEELKTLGPA